MNIFTIAANDQSIYYLGRIFGNVGTVLPGTGPGLLAAMFKIFNTAMLAIGALIVTYTTIIGVLHTAGEGKFLGAKWNSMWVPIRTVVGIAGLMPTKTGYCAIQIILMWFILQGVGAADTVWTGVIDYFKKGGATQTPVPSMNLAGYTKFPYLFKALTCNEALKRFYCLLGTNDPVLCKTPTAYSSQFSYYPIPGALGNTCGSIGVDSSVSPAIQDAQKSAYASIFPTMQQISRHLVSIYADLQKFYSEIDRYNAAQAQKAQGLPVDDVPQPQKPTWLVANANVDACRNPSGDKIAECANLLWTYALQPYVGSNFIRDSVNLYQGSIMSVATQGSAGTAAGSTVGSIGTYGATAAASPIGTAAGVGGLIGMLVGNANVTSALDTAAANGWIFAGGYYYFIASMTNKVIAGANADPNITAVKNDSTIPNQTARDLTNVAENISQRMMNAQSAGGGEGTFGGGISSGGGTGNPVLDVLAGGLGGLIIQGWMATLSGTTGGGGDSIQVNPVTNLQVFGQTILTLIQIIFLVLLVIVFTTTTLAGTMSSIQGAGQGLSTTYQYVLWPVLFFMAALFMMAATFAVYIPMIPYIIFTFGAIGWMIATIEAMVAGPIVALGILHPEGQHEVWGKAEPAVQIIMNIFLRPVLMIFGLMTGMLLSYVVVTLINAGFIGVAQSIIRAPGLVETFFFMAIYTAMIVTSLNKCFALIHIIPDHVLNWIGMTGKPGGVEAGAEGEIGKEAKGTLGTGQGAAKGFGDKAAAMRGGDMKDRDEKAAKAKAALEATPSKTEPPKTS